jgi:hypothetical protein
MQRDISMNTNAKAHETGRARQKNTRGNVKQRSRTNGGIRENFGTKGSTRKAGIFTAKADLKI